MATLARGLTVHYYYSMTHTQRKPRPRPDRATFEAVITQHDHWWDIHVPAFDLHTSAVHENDLVPHAKRLLASILRMPAEDIELKTGHDR